MRLSAHRPLVVVSGPFVRPMTLTWKFVAHGLKRGLLESAGIAPEDRHPC